jgi:hypothetical protein
MAFKKKTKYLPADSSNEKKPAVKGRLFTLPSSPVPWALLDKLQIGRCSYCGKPIKVFSNIAYNEGDKRKPPLFYSCSAGCEKSGIQRAGFIDRKLIEFVKNRLSEKVGEFKWGLDESTLMMEFEQLTELAKMRKNMLTEMAYGGRDHDKLLKQIVNIENTYENQKNKLDTFDHLPLDENPLIGLMIEKEIDYIMGLDVNYLQKILSFTVINIRFFDDFLLLRSEPLDEREYEITDGFGPQNSIHLRRIHKSNITTDSSDDESDSD